MATARPARHDVGRVGTPAKYESTVEQGAITVAAELVNRLESIVADVVTAAGYELDSLDVQQASRRKLVKVVIDADDGVASDEIAVVSHAVSKELDQHEDVLAGAYTLEVTSPGVTRPLTSPRHWRRAKFRQVRVTPSDGADFRVRVGDADDHSVRVLTGGQLRDLRYADVSEAVIEVEFRQPPAEELRKLTADEPQKKEDSR